MLTASEVCRIPDSACPISSYYHYERSEAISDLSCPGSHAREKTSVIAMHVCEWKEQICQGELRSPKHQRLRCHCYLLFAICYLLFLTFSLLAAKASLSPSKRIVLAASILWMPASLQFTSETRKLPSMRFFRMPHLPPSIPVPSCQTRRIKLESNCGW